MTYRNRIGQDGPKRLLALDGGGIRGVLSLEILAAIETLLRRELGRGDEMFGKASMMRRFRYQYDSTRLEKMLKSTFGADTTFGDDGLRTLLMMVLRNASTDSPWPLSNNPGAKYNAADRADNNLSLLLWQLVRASTAAPVHFPPEVVTIGNHEFVFVDGGLTMYTNQAFQLYLMATLEAYGLGWPVGEDKLLVVSVGTRAAPKADDRLRPGDMNLLYNAGSVPSALMAAALAEQDLLCRVFGRSRHSADLDREAGHLRGGPGLIEPQLFTYVRYDALLTRDGLEPRPDRHRARVGPEARLRGEHARPPADRYADRARRRSSPFRGLPVSPADRPLCFVLMPFGTKPDGTGRTIDFDRVYDVLRLMAQGMMNTATAKRLALSEWIVEAPSGVVGVEASRVRSLAAR